jgi:hypothetical protein
MSARRYTEITCDFGPCDTAITWSGSAVDVRQFAAERGWNIAAKADFCPDHRTRASRMHIAAPGGGSS